MSIPASFVPAFRTMRSDRYVDSCVAVRVAGVSFNESTGRTEPTTAQVYAHFNHRHVLPGQQAGVHGDNLAIGHAVGQKRFDLLR
jgi:hypothetical protein